jgi:predicted transcriptional regulator of viral defense system
VLSRDNDKVNLAPRRPRRLESGDRLRLGETTLHLMGTNLHKAKPEIVAFFEHLETKVHRRSDLEEFLARNSNTWHLSRSLTLTKFTEFLIEETPLSQERFRFPNRPETRYVWGDVSTYTIVQSLKTDSYFTHETAIYLNGLRNRPPKTIYLNQEQTPKPKQGTPLEQHRIDQAFGRPARMSQNKATYRKKTICILNGMKTGELGVINIQGPNGESLRVTNIERTLIDAAVRPSYSGGPAQVLKAYKRARGHVSVERLAQILQKLDYVYPYHQAIGFYLEQAGVYDNKHLHPFEELPITYDFYLTHEMQVTNYSKRWRLYFPTELKSLTN